jgi:hypothetical protein
MSASDFIQGVSAAYAAKLGVQRTIQGPQVSTAFAAISEEAAVGRLHRLGPGSDFDMPKTTATSHRYLPYLQQVTQVLN